MEEKIKLNYENMQEYFRQTVEFIFLDQAEIIPGKSATGIKLLSAQDWYFKYHFPGNPVMPGVFQMEAIMQTAGLIINTIEGKKEIPIMFKNCKSANVFKIARPGSILRTSAILKSYRRGVAWFQGEAWIGEEVSCSIEFSLIVPDEIQHIFRGKDDDSDETVRE